MLKTPRHRGYSVVRKIGELDHRQLDNFILRGIQASGFDIEQNARP
jgi:hypothetical protein